MMDRYVVPSATAWFATSGGRSVHQGVVGEETRSSAAADIPPDRQLLTHAGYRHRRHEGPKPTRRISTMAAGRLRHNEPM